MDETYHKLVYTWKYEPKDLFQGEHNLVIKPYTITISDGKIIAEVYNTDAKGHHFVIQDHVENYFKAASIISGLEYTIDKDYKTEAFDEKGKKVPAFFIPTFTASSYAFPIRMTVPLTDKEKQQIIEDEKILGEFFAKYYHAEDPIIRFIYESYKASLTEERFLIYLYDIIEAMCVFLYKNKSNNKKDKKKNKDKLKDDLDPEKKIKWEKFFKLINDARHPGPNYTSLRNITPSEKAEIMEAVKKIMLAFFKKLMNDPKLVERLDQK